MNHSCRPTCGVEFDFAARILVLQQPYVDIQKGAGEPGSLGAWELFSFSAAGGTELTISYLDSSLDAQARQSHDSEE